MIINCVFGVVCGSDWDGLCSKYTIPYPSLGWSSPPWFQHSPTSWPAKIWGKLLFCPSYKPIFFSLFFMVGDWSTWDHLSSNIYVLLFKCIIYVFLFKCMTRSSISIFSDSIIQLKEIFDDKQLMPEKTTKIKKTNWKYSKNYCFLKKVLIYFSVPLSL